MCSCVSTIYIFFFKLDSAIYSLLVYEKKTLNLYFFLGIQMEIEYEGKCQRSRQ
jgi:hypothetical protein